MSFRSRLGRVRSSILMTGGLCVSLFLGTKIAVVRGL